MLRMALGILAPYLMMSCGDEGKSIGAPAIKPPVENNMPSGFAAAALKLIDGVEGTAKADMDPAVAIKDYFFPAGDFVGPLERLGFIDDRMNSLNKRSEESARKCISEGVGEYEIGAQLPGAVTFAQKYNCQEDLGGGPAGEGIKKSLMAFGMADDLLYLNEHRYDEDGSAIVVLVQAATNGKRTDVWDVRYNATDEQADVLHILGDDNTGVVEVTSSGTDVTGNSGALACGMHAKSKGSLLYFTGRIAAGGSCRDEETVCYNSETLTAVDVGECEAAGLNTFTLGTLSPEVMAEAYDGIKLIAAKDIEGFTSFNDDAK